MAIRHRTRSRPVMMSEPAGEVGYGKPPQHTRFQAGKSGNPKGRPRKSVALDPVLGRILGKKVPVTRNGSIASISLLEAIIEQLSLAAAKGNNASQRLVMKLARERDVALAEAEAAQASRPEQVCSSDDAEIVALLREEILAEAMSDLSSTTPLSGPYIKKVR